MSLLLYALVAERRTTPPRRRRNYGPSTSTSAFDQYTVRVLTRSIDFANMTAVHVSGPYFMGVKFIPLFQKSADPVIVNITSLGAFFLNK